MWVVFSRCHQPSSSTLVSSVCLTVYCFSCFSSSAHDANLFSSQILNSLSNEMESHECETFSILHFNEKKQCRIILCSINWLCVWVCVLVTVTNENPQNKGFIDSLSVFNHFMHTRMLNPINSMTSRESQGKKIQFLKKKNLFHLLREQNQFFFMQFKNTSFQHWTKHN